MRRVIWLQNPTVLLLGEGITSLSYGMYRGLILGRLENIQQCH
jgi:hypothetical protein